MESNEGMVSYLIICVNSKKDYDPDKDLNRVF
jgi:hypothetical protein